MRALNADEIEVRVGQVFQKGVSMLLYKNARVDMAILDETCGEFGWMCDYKEIKGNMYCGIAVLNEASGDWVWKWDIGRELYTAPFIWLNVATKPKASGKGYELNNPRELNGIFVSQIKTEEVNGKYKITALELSQRAQGKDMVVYQWKER